MSTHARDTMEAAVRRELFGPDERDSPKGQPLDTRENVSFERKEDAYGPWHDLTTGEEVLTSDPLRRYGIGVLFAGAAAETPDPLVGVAGLPQEGDEDIEFDATASELTPSQPNQEPDPYDFDLSDANSFQPAAMAITFLAKVPAGSKLNVSGSCASYERFIATVVGQSRTRDWWVRRPFTFGAVLDAQDLAGTGHSMRPFSFTFSDTLDHNLGGVAYSRPAVGLDDPDLRMVTVALRNGNRTGGAASAFFQVMFSVEVASGAKILPYPESPWERANDEEQSLDLLYREEQTYALGHGCAAGWEHPIAGESGLVRSEPLPGFTVPSLTPDIHYQTPEGERRKLTIKMHDLAEGLPEGERDVELLLDHYDRWIERLEAEKAALAPKYLKAAGNHIEACKRAAERMRAGWTLVKCERDVTTAFRLANHAMIDQQRRSKLDRRATTLSSDGSARVDGVQPSIASFDQTETWRPFQIGFILSVLPEIFDPRGHDRETVDLIFFPTGGGKTEAYLGVAAISMLLRRMRDPGDSGTDVLMRYTLRLLTSQQFRRAASLLCVLEDIRTRAIEELGLNLGSEPFSIGIWLGSSTTPNTWSTALKQLSKMENDSSAQNPFLLLRCPWCAAQMGPVTIPESGGKRRAVGYARNGRTSVSFVCPDNDCRFAAPNKLPVHVVDDEIYDVSPTLVIGTVDKFAMLAWRPRARALFGIGPAGTRVASPPSLIIQDELHLISGPLGSMVSLYEPVIEALCSDSRTGSIVRPKIVASTATVRNAPTQILGLYGRTETTVFPPHGLIQGSSFFAERALNEDGSPVEGRRYIGVFAPSMGSIQTLQVRVAAATLEGALDIPVGERDGYWTNLNFMNSLRELGNTVSLLQSDIRDYITGIRRRDGLPEVRWPRVTMELTSRRENDEIPQAIEELETPYPQKGCVDVCLASNIIEVGVDIDRLSLMTIVGQPKTTAQYIQVSGRVGRRADRPGLVLVLYSAAKPRDRSHYERFTSYHQRLYAQVEPTSLTPFARPVMQRGLHGAALSFLRQSEHETLQPYPFPDQPFRDGVDLLRSRARLVDPAEMTGLDAISSMRLREGVAWQRTNWDANQWGGGSPEDGLMRFPGSTFVPGSLTWEVPTSMRNVDAECRLQITTKYLEDDALASGDVS